MSSKINWLVVSLMASLVLGVGCTSDKEKAKKVLKKKLKACKNKAEATEAFQEVSIFGGDEKREVLTESCDQPISNFDRKDEFSFRAEVGPYTWHVGLETDLGVWIVADVEWDLIEKIRRKLDQRELNLEQMNELEGLLGKAQTQFPESSWIRLERLEVLLDLRARNRKLNDKKPLELGTKADSYIDETISWANKNGSSDVKNEADYLVAKHFVDMKDWLDGIVNPSATRDEWLKNSIEAAKEKGNAKEAEKYQKELEKTREKRKKRRKKAQKLMESLEDKLCNHVSKLEAKNQILKKKIKSLRSRTNCEN